MRINILKKNCIPLFAIILMLASCIDEKLQRDDTPHNLQMSFSTRSGGTAKELVSSLRLFAFNENGPNNNFFNSEINNIVRDAANAKVSAQAEVGKWRLAMISDPDGTATVIPPTISAVMDSLPMYIYKPVVVNGKSSDAAELFFASAVTPEITSGGNHNMSAQLNRTVAKVEVILHKVTSNFVHSSSQHKVFLENIPSTIGYTGKILPAAASPAMIPVPLQAPVSLVKSNTYQGFLEAADTITFIIPAHQGKDFITDENTGDTIRTKMDLTVILERTGGTLFQKKVQISRVAKCNKILRINVTVNDGVELTTNIVPWYSVNLQGSVGAPYSNWLYVMKGSSGSGTSWNDPLDNITLALAQANALTKAGKKVHGILVAGGAAHTYAESFEMPDNIRIFGGWEGVPGTELNGNDSDAPYKSSDRNLSLYKAYLQGGVKLSGQKAVIDGFNLSGGAVSNYEGVLHIAHADAYANAIEIVRQKNIAAAYTLKMDAGRATNILIAENTPGVYLGKNATLVNATFANVTGKIEVAGTLQNSAVWRSTVTADGSPVIQNCLFDKSLNATLVDGAVLSDRIYPMNNTNQIWFTTTNVMPGPHFNLGDDPLNAYCAGTDTPDRSPLLGRGEIAYFNNVSSGVIPRSYQTDINGKPRNFQGLDIGCYESSNSKGFSLRWATDRVYVSYKATYTSEQPLMIPDNDLYDIGVNWTASVEGALNYTKMMMGETSVTSLSGSGTGIVVGSLGFRNDGNVTPDDDYTGSQERKCGVIKMSTNLGNYLPDATIEVYQTAGKVSQLTSSYVGSFHKNDQRGARFITGKNFGDWNARIISGLDWIKIDANNKEYGENITDPSEGLTPSGGNYKEVEQVWKGVVFGTGNIQFRVGMQSKNTTGKPRYGMIIITHSGGVSMFFVRQGEQDDYLYRAEDAKPSEGDRNDLVKFSPYNLSDPGKNENTDGADIGPGKAVFVDFPTKIGYYFQWNQTVAYCPGSARTLPVIKSDELWYPAKEVCPPGYRHATHSEFINTLYYNVHPDAGNGRIDPSGDDAKKNAAWGAYADGYFDQLASNPVNTGEEYSVGNGPDMGVKGTLMVNHYNYSSIFFPGGGRMAKNGSISGIPYSMYFTSSKYYKNQGSNAHWKNGHIGMNCTPISNDQAGTTRCVKAPETY